MKYVLIILLFFFLGCEKKDEITTPTPLHVKPESKALHVKDIKKELSKIDTKEYLEDYIVKIINEGSKQNMGFATKTMDAGIAHSMDAKNIARYTMILRNEKSSNDALAKKAEIFYTSNCGGCHGNDGKGLNGTFPDLTITPLIGIKLRKEFLKDKLKD